MTDLSHSERFTLLAAMEAYWFANKVHHTSSGRQQLMDDLNGVLEKNGIERLTFET